jgi:hypothetical protein
MEFSFSFYTNCNCMLTTSEGYLLPYLGYSTLDWIVKTQNINDMLSQIQRLSDSRSYHLGSHTSSKNPPFMHKE